ncbi:MAG: conjugative transfer signal peptidase TraF [Burkholderiaceae bacterium]|nr:conjugative transfer signal peptidase TraF [Burkholderiaceae bacterium]
MKGRLQRMTAGVAIGGAGLLLLGVVCFAIGARVNTTRSIPVGLYWTSSQPVHKGVDVLFCPPQVGVLAVAKQRGYIGAGFCPGGYGYMMKRVVAVQNDVVAVTPDGVLVNGELLPQSRPLKVDQAGRLLTSYPVGSFTLGSTEVLLMSSESRTSFDGRYFGPVPRAQISAVILPILTW